MSTGFTSEKDVWFKTLTISQGDEKTFCARAPAQSLQTFRAVERRTPFFSTKLLNLCPIVRFPLQRKLIDMIGTNKLGDVANLAKNIKDHEYKYFLSQFASTECNYGGQYRIIL